jgi:hypothetical protein
LYDFFKAPLRRGFFFVDAGGKPPLAAWMADDQVAACGHLRPAPADSTPRFDLTVR